MPCPSQLSQLHFSYGYLISELCLLSTIPKNISAKDPISEMCSFSKTPVTEQSQTLSKPKLSFVSNQSYTPPILSLKKKSFTFLEQSSRKSYIS